jgi:general secretion pathway protein G
MKSILLLLALMVCSVVNAASDRARPIAARADIANLKVILDRFSADCGRYPTTPEGLSALIRCPTNIPTGRWHGSYLDPAQIPIDPWGNEYVYRFPGIHNTNGYDLYSCGSDGISKSGGNDADDINNWDTNSPRGTFSDRLETLESNAIPILLAANLFQFVALSIIAKFLSRVRDFIARHPTVRDVYTWLTLVGILFLLISLVIPRQV